MLRGSSSDDVTGRGVTSLLISLFTGSELLCLLQKQRQGLQICVVLYHLALPRSMIVAIKQITWNQLHWLKLLHASYIFRLRQAGKAGVFYSADKCFETEADPRNIFHKQIVKVWTPCLSAFYCVIPRATLAWSLKACAISRFRNQRARGQKTIGSPHSGQTQKSNATSGFRRLELRKSLKRKPARLL